MRGRLSGEAMLIGYFAVLIFIAAAVFFVAFSLFLSRLVRPSKPNPEKLSTYECGEDPIGSPWIQFNIRFYVFALIFIIFDVEVVFLLPWAVVFDKLGVLALVEGLIFIFILLAALAYLWAKGDLEWVRPRPGPRSQ